MQTSLSFCIWWNQHLNVVHSWVIQLILEIRTNTSRIHWVPANWALGTIQHAYKITPSTKKIAYLKLSIVIQFSFKWAEISTHIFLTYFLRSKLYFNNCHGKNEYYTSTVETKACLQCNSLKLLSSMATSVFATKTKSFFYVSGRFKRETRKKFWN